MTQLRQRMLKGDWTVEVIRRSDKAKAFKVLPRTGLWNDPSHGWEDADDQQRNGKRQSKAQHAWRSSQTSVSSCGVWQGISIYGKLLNQTLKICRRSRGKPMTESHEELLQIADRLDRLAAQSEEAGVQEPLEQLQQAASQIGKAWSGSKLGYHANVYYENLKPPPRGVHWGDTSFLGDHEQENWYEYNSETVKEAVQGLAGNPDLEAARDFNREAAQEFDTLKSDVLSIIEIERIDNSDSFLNGLNGKITGLSALSTSKKEEHLSPKGKVWTRYRIDLDQEYRLPPHIAVIAEVSAIQHTVEIIQDLSKYSRQAGSHLSRQRQRRRKSGMAGTNIFIGHGQSLVWRELKDFIEGRLNLPVDEFNRVPVAGVTNIARLSEMLDAAAIAFLIMTGEDEQPDGKLHARMNVVHEAGLCQGRLGFERAIVLLEEGCEEFSNIGGLGQIRFPKGKIKAAFEDIRQVLEREEIVEAK